MLEDCRYYPCSLPQPYGLGMLSSRPSTHALINSHREVVCRRHERPSAGPSGRYVDLYSPQHSLCGRPTVYEAAVAEHDRAG